MPGPSDERLRCTLTDDGVTGLRITVPPPRRWFVVLFLSLWLCGWAAGEAYGLKTLVLNKGWAGPDATFLLLWLTFWTAGGLFALWIVAWNLAGYDVVTIDEADGTLTVERSLGPYRRVRAYDLAGVSQLRFLPTSFDVGLPLGGRPLLRPNGSITFDHHGKTRKFGDRLSEAEAERIILTVRQRVKLKGEGDAPESLPVSH